MAEPAAENQRSRSPPAHREAAIHETIKPLYLKML